MTDVLIFQTPDNGDVATNDLGLIMTDSIESAFYLSLFGGNEDGSTWWGDVDTLDPANKYPSKTQTILRAGTLTTGRLLDIEDASRLDLKWSLDKGAVSSLKVVATMPGLNKVLITVSTESDTFLFEWQAEQ